MNNRDAKSKSNDDLGRHQRVLDAYLAHPGSEHLPPPGLDAKLIALAASSVKVTTSTQRAEASFARNEVDAIKDSAPKTSARARRRQWPFALAASVATIGFAAILARTTFHEAPDYGAPSYEAKSAASEQAQVDATAAVAARVASDAAAAASEGPAVAKPSALQEESRLESRDQVASLEDKAKLSGASEAEFERAAEQAFGRVPAAPEPVAAAAPGNSNVIVTGAVAADDNPVGSSTAGAAEKTLAEPLPELNAAPAPIYEASPAPAASAPPAEVVELDMQAIDARGRRTDTGASAPSTEDGVAQTAAAPMPLAKASATGGIVVAEEKPAPRESPQPQTVPAQPGASTRGELAITGENTPVADAAVPTNSKKDEFAADAQADSANAHTNAYAAIRALRDSGDLPKAKAMLARFKKVYPQVVLPEDLKVLEKVK